MSAKRLLRDGKPASKVFELSSPAKVRMPSKRVQALMKTVYNRYQRLDDPAVNAQCRQDFVFHMSDWEADLEDLARLFQNPDKFSKDSAGQIVFSFLIHALPHLIAASRLMLG